MMANEERISLQNALISLQKSFSRLSRETGKMQMKDKLNEEAFALIIGNVDFEIEFTAEFEKEVIYLNPEGDVRLKFNGAIATDLKLEEDNN